MKLLGVFIAFIINSGSHARQEESSELTHYLFPAFSQGIIQMKSGIRNVTTLNYNSLTEEMVFEKKGTRLAISDTEMQQVDTVFIEDRKFIVQDLRFVEVIHHSNDWDLFVEHKCDLQRPGNPVGYGMKSETSSVATYSSLSASGVMYNLELPEGYKTKPYRYYWLQKDGKLVRAINMNQLKKIYKEHSSEYKTYQKQWDVAFDDQGSIIQLVTYLESLETQ